MKKINEEDLVFYKDLTLHILMTIFVLFLLFRGLNNWHWNLGKCDCGGEWIYKETRARNTVDVYECNECGKILNTWSNYHK